MKKLALLSLLALGSRAYAESAPSVQSETTRGLTDLTIQAADVNCNVPPVCDSPSPLKRGICLLKGLGQGGFSAACGVICFMTLIQLYKQSLITPGSARLFYLRGAGALFGTVVVGADAFQRSLNNFSTVVADKQ
jgi:hypothetical protein